MSHIVKGQVKIAYKEKELLIRALEGLGEVYEKEKLYRVAVGMTSEKYDLVLIDRKNEKYRIGFNFENGVWNQYQEDYGTYGNWTKKISDQIQDRYIAFHYEQNLKEEGFDVTIQEYNDGTLELVAEEASW